MNPNRLPGQGPSLVQRIAAAAIGGVLVVALFFVGLFAWVLIAGFALVASAGLAVWFWRQKRRLARFRAAHEEALRQADEGHPRRGPDGAIEGEYIVVTERRQRDRAK